MPSQSQVNTFVRSFVKYLILYLERKQSSLTLPIFLSKLCFETTNLTSCTVEKSETVKALCIFEQK